MFGITKRLLSFTTPHWPYGPSLLSSSESIRKRRVSSTAIMLDSFSTNGISDDFTQLNEKFIKARRDYESLLEASMAQPQQPYGGRPYGGYNAPPYGGYPPTSPPPQQE